MPLPQVILPSHLQLSVLDAAGAHSERGPDVANQKLGLLSSGPPLWNSLPVEVRMASMLLSFRKCENLGFYLGLDIPHPFVTLIV